MAAVSFLLSTCRDGNSRGILLSRGRCARRARLTLPAAERKLLGPKVELHDLTFGSRGVDCTTNDRGYQREIVRVQEHMTFADGVCRFRPQGVVSLVEGVALITSAIALCRAKGGTKILVDITGLSGFSVPTLVDRYWMAQDWAQAAQGRLIVAIVARAE
ncbi:MAG: hypothetical protein ABI569_16040, partial [Casimicrobiaceae bacterium]